MNNLLHPMPALFVPHGAPETRNLAHFMRMSDTIPEYVTAFQAWMRNKLETKDVASLLDSRKLAPDAPEAHPTEEHWLPFYTALGAAGAGFTSEIFYSGIQHNMLAMDSFAFWPTNNALN